MSCTIPAPRTCRRCGRVYTVLTDVRYTGMRVSTCPTCLRNPAATGRPAVVKTPDLSAGLCYGSNDDTWYPDDKDTHGVAFAKRICERCPVRDACLQFAVDTHQPDGIWGGKTVRERERIIRRSAA